jgi:hypothetical protein
MTSTLPGIAMWRSWQSAKADSPRIRKRGRDSKPTARNDVQPEKVCGAKLSTVRGIRRQSVESLDTQRLRKEVIRWHSPAKTTIDRTRRCRRGAVVVATVTQSESYLRRPPAMLAVSMSEDRPPIVNFFTVVAWRGATLDE